MACNILKQLQSGLVMWLDWNGKDLSGNSNNGTLTNAPTKVRRLQNDGLSYNGTNQYITLPAWLVTGWTNTFTFSAWIKFLDASVAQSIFMWGDASTGCWIYFSSGSLRFSNIWGGNQLNLAYTITTWVWTHFTWTTDSNGVRLYKNGTLLSSNAGTANWSATTSTTGVGWQIYGGIIQAGAYMNGSIMNPILWNRTLSAKEIAMLYISTYIH